jgi:hypothetical protein
MPVGNLTRSEITKALTKAAIMHMVRYGFAVYREIGLSRGGTLRADLLCLNFKKKLVVMEIKSSMADLTSDSKWPKYLSLCDQLMFVMPEKVWKALKDKPARGAGVLILEEKTGHLKSVQFAKTQELLDDETRDYLILRMAYRAAEFSKRNVKRRTRVYLK